MRDSLAQKYGGKISEKWVLKEGVTLREIKTIIKARQHRQRLQHHPCYNQSNPSRLAVKIRAGGYLQASTVCTTISLPSLELVSQTSTPVGLAGKHDHYTMTSGVSSGQQDSGGKGVLQGYKEVYLPVT